MSAVIKPVQAFVQNHIHVILGVTNLLIAVLWAVSVGYVKIGQKAETDEERETANKVYIGTHIGMITVFAVIVAVLFLHGDKKN